MKDALTAVVGNDSLRARLGNDLLAGTLPHALILEGPRGSGKHTIARMISAALICTKKDTPHLPIPCMECPACKKVLEEKSPDVIVVGREEDRVSIGVNVARFLREDAQILPNDTDHKIYIVEDADRMTENAQNALLLTLEEPPSYVHFILLCENAGLLLETIRSRAPILRTQPVSLEEMDRYLTEHDRRAAQMKLSNPDGYADLLMAARSGIGNALDYLEPKVFSSVQKVRSSVAELVVTAVKKGSPRQVLPLLNRMPTKRDTLKEYLETLTLAIRDLILLKKSDDATLCFYYDREAAMELCDSTSLIFLYELESAVRQALEELSGNANVRLCLLKMAMSAHLI